MRARLDACKRASCRSRYPLTDDRHESLLHLDCCSLLFQFRAHSRGLVLGHAGLDITRRTVDEILRFLETQAGELTHDLDDLNLLRSRFLEYDLELGLLFNRGCWSCTGATRCRSGSANRRGRDRDVELALESLDELGQLENRHVADRFENLVLAHGCVCHCCYSPGDF